MRERSDVLLVRPQGDAEADEGHQVEVLEACPQLSGHVHAIRGPDISLLGCWDIGQRYVGLQQRLHLGHDLTYGGILAQAIHQSLGRCHLVLVHLVLNDLLAELPASAVAVLEGKDLVESVVGVVHRQGAHHRLQQAVEAAVVARPAPGARHAGGHLVYQSDKLVGRCLGEDFLQLLCDGGVLKLEPEVAQAEDGHQVVLGPEHQHSAVVLQRLQKVLLLVLLEGGDLCLVELHLLPLPVQLLVQHPRFVVEVAVLVFLYLAALVAQPGLLLQLQHPVLLGPQHCHLHCTLAAALLFHRPSVQLEGVLCQPEVHPAANHGPRRSLRRKAARAFHAVEDVVGAAAALRREPLGCQAAHLRRHLHVGGLQLVRGPGQALRQLQRQLPVPLRPHHLEVLKPPGAVRPRQPCPSLPARLCRHRRLDPRHGCPSIAKLPGLACCPGSIHLHSDHRLRPTAQQLQQHRVEGHQRLHEGKATARLRLPTLLRPLDLQLLEGGAAVGPP
mmetsp:Transcript_4049/g.11434  ORF Transcript_4049/g.11434 Transcript_4049/m.11434 type:complete len:501 (-) Transcript_4049:1056-2558(-)